jgi:hypothetical protein
LRLRLGVAGCFAFLLLVRTKSTREGWPLAAEVLPFLVAATALARRARQAGERLYCWSCL